MLVSILHRATGMGNVVGLAILLWWLGALASGADAYATFAWAMTTPLGYLVLFGVSLSLFMHMMSGLRHFVLDVGAGYELTTNKTWSIAAPLIGIALAVLFWAVLLLR
jgi:succinate dehydrogenase / fumarate reductase, cytochrome b subunit